MKHCFRPALIVMHPLIVVSKSMYFFHAESVSRRHCLILVHISCAALMEQTGREPTEDTRICSRDSVGNAKTSEQEHPACLPTIFASPYKKAGTASSCQRYERCGDIYPCFACCLGLTELNIHFVLDVFYPQFVFRAGVILARLMLECYFC